jgi:peptidoglycan/LPS O-acetylase OafA/YrhL
MKYPHIDSARGIAILMVILIHTAQSVHQAVLDFKFIPHIIHEYGQMGVQLFFVVSAFTLDNVSYFSHIWVGLDRGATRKSSKYED